MQTDQLVVDNFKIKFKYYKSNKPKPSLSEVISLVNISNHTDKVNKLNLNNISEDSRTDLLGLRNINEWELYTFQYHPGLFLIKNPFTALGQRYWIRKCLETYPRKPNKLNTDIEVLLPDWWAECFDNGMCNRLLQKKLRWSTLGYHHNWDTKIYTDENKSLFPEDLAELSDVVARYIGYTDFRAEAAIVNYYHMDSTLSAHTDHSEVNLEAPLFSFRLCSHIFVQLDASTFHTLSDVVKINTIESAAILLQDEDEDVRILSTIFYKNISQSKILPHPYICLQKLLDSTFLNGVLSNPKSGIQKISQDLTAFVSKSNNVNNDIYNPFANDSKNIYLEVEILQQLVQNLNVY